MSFTVIVSGIRIREKTSVGGGNVQFENLQPRKKRGSEEPPGELKRLKALRGFYYLAGTMIVCPSLRKERPKRWFLLRIAEMVVRNLFARAKRDSPLRILCRIHRLEPS